MLPNNLKLEWLKPKNPFERRSNLNGIGLVGVTGKEPPFVNASDYSNQTVGKLIKDTYEVSLYRE